MSLHAKGWAVRYTTPRRTVPTCLPVAATRTPLPLCSAVRMRYPVHDVYNAQEVLIDG